MSFKFDRSKEMFEQAKQYVAAGVASNLRLAMKPVPLFIDHAKGSRITDVDGNTYIDYIMAYGPQILGHAHPRFVDAIRRQSEKGQAYGAQHQGEIELARKITAHVPCAERVSFSSTGSEAVHVALRLSRAFTGRSKILRFEGHYHGWFDNMNTSASFAAAGEAVPATEGQDPSALREVVQIAWNDAQALEEAFERHAGQLAAVITEPIMCNSGCLSPLPGYMDRLRELTAAHGTVLIFDEVITGFRLGLGGAQTALGITPDLATLGKAVAGGMPLSAVAGKKEIMDLIAANRVNHMGTLNGNALCTAAAVCTIEELEAGGGEAYNRMYRLSERLTGAMRRIAANEDLPFQINSRGTVFHTMITEESPIERYEQFVRRDANTFADLAEIMLEEGLMVRPSGLWYISAAHTEEDIAQTAHLFEKSVKRLKKK